MYEGKILKYYREKSGLTQTQLGQGICSVTHVSKIERGLTEYSSEVTQLLAEKLDINLKQKEQQIVSVKEKLKLFHEMIIFQNYQYASSIQQELKDDYIISLSGYEALFQLLQLNFHIKQNELQVVKNGIKWISRKYDQLSEYEQNLYQHICGLYYMAMENFPKSIQILKKINLDKYSNPLIYYDLALAYYFSNLPVMSYHHAQKALQLYKHQNNFLGIIDTENLMLIQIESDYRNPKETNEKYENLIHICELCNTPEKKAKILHNYAYEHLKQKRYEDATRLYKESMDLKEKETEVYLLSLEGYIRSTYEGKLLLKNELLQGVKEGLNIAKVINAFLYTTVFTLHQFIIQGQFNRYYEYLEQKAIPYFKSHGYTALAKRYEKKLFNHFIQTKNTKKIIDFGESIVKL